MLLQVSRYPVRQRAGIHSPRLTRNFPPVSEYRHGGNAADIVLGRGALRLFGVEFGKACARFQLRGNGLEMWCHHLTGAAPGGPEIHHHRQVAAAYVPGKTLIGQFNGPTGKQQVFAFSAARLLFQAFGRDTVNRVAVWAHQVY